MTQDRLLAEFDAHHERLCTRCLQLEGQLQQMLSASGLKIHSVSSRVKPRESLSYKISRPEKTYHRLEDITDVVGLRITTYFEDTVEAVARLIESQFRVDFAHSTDKLQNQNHSHFGYRSLHYICQSSDAAETPEKFEIQIRTVLQHAWAEIEHDLGYKAIEAVPSDIRRRFSRIASLLEVADEEFVSIRRDLESYERKLSETHWDPSQALPLDGASLQSLVQSESVLACDRAIAELLDKKLDGQLFFPDYLLKMLKLSGFHTTTDVHQSLTQNQARVLKMVKPYFDFSETTWKMSAQDLKRVPRGYSLFFLSHLGVIESQMLELSKVGKVAQFYRELDYPNDERTAHSVASHLIEILKNSGF